MRVNISGKKGLSKEGKDIFGFVIRPDGIFPYHNGNPEKCLVYVSDSGNADTECTGWVINFGNMDYLKLKNGKCPNGTTLSATQTSCK